MFCCKCNTVHSQIQQICNICRFYKASKKWKVVTSTDSDTVETVSQLDGAALSPTPPTPEPAPPDFKNLPPDGDGWCTFKPSLRNPR